MTSLGWSVFLALGVTGVYAWLEIEGKDGSGWGLVALILVMVSCSMIEQ